MKVHDKEDEGNAKKDADEESKESPAQAAVKVDSPEATEADKEERKTPVKEAGESADPVEPLSPQLEAKLSTLKQMFPDTDSSVLSNILFDQCGGDLD